jgi:hypothetical protein
MEREVRLQHVRTLSAVPQQIRYREFAVVLRRLLLLLRQFRV